MMMPLGKRELLIDFDLNRKRSRDKKKLRIKCLTIADYIMWSAVLASACEMARSLCVYVYVCMCMLADGLLCCRHEGVG